MKEYEFHEAANIFPLADGDELDSLTEDIKQNGQMRPIELCDDKIIDGRRRSLACEKAGVKPNTIEVNPSDPVAYVLSLNLHRRHLSTSQRAMVAARARKFYDDQAKERMKLSEGRGHKKGMENLPDLSTGSARDQAGRAVNVSGKTVDDASRVLRNGTPELIKAVDEDKISVSYAARFSTHPAETQNKIAESSKGRPNSRKDTQPELDELPAGQSIGKGVRYANEAIDCLKRIPKNDALRKRGFQIVTDWIRHNK